MGQVGLTYGVLYRGQVVPARGHGFRDAEKRKEADERTLFNIASCTKAFTATACVLLANEGLLDLNAPVKRYLPELKEEEATLIDLLAHRTGYARLDMSWVGQRSEVLVCITFRVDHESERFASTSQFEKRVALQQLDVRSSGRDYRTTQQGRQLPRLHEKAPAR
jgi:CubicO group peptidase (beta-lactamase class C family)